MGDALPRSHVAAAAVLLLAAGLVGARLGAGGDSPREPAAPVAVEVESAAGDAPAGRAVVHVAGAVRRPGVYALRAGSRVDDAVRRAGGATPRADLSGLNLAAEVQDGRQVLVPARAGGSSAAASAAASPAAAGDALGAVGSAPIDLNTATLEQLDALEGIGPTTAQKILDWRAERGGFGSVEELSQIPGIGEKRMATLRERVTA